MSPKMTPERIREARERCEKATEGPWDHGTYSLEPHVKHRFTDEEGRSCTSFIAACNGTMTKKQEDAEFIAHARTDLPDALDDLEEVTRKNHWLRQNLVAPAIADRVRRLESALEEARKWLRWAIETMGDNWTGLVSDMESARAALGEEASDDR